MAPLVIVFHWGKIGDVRISEDPLKGFNLCNCRKVSFSCC
jgi:hypothetical protein